MRVQLTLLQHEYNQMVAAHRVTEHDLQAQVRRLSQDLHEARADQEPLRQRVAGPQLDGAQSCDSRELDQRPSAAEACTDTSSNNTISRLPQIDRPRRVTTSSINYKEPPSNTKLRRPG
eukprot:SM005136S17659  [mRNA]  locus=s5136:168:758:+ [translate_table: standard]